MSYAVKILNCRQCRACYEADITPSELNLKNMKKTIREVIGKNKSGEDRFTVHGGEPLLLDFDFLKWLLKISYDNYGHSGIQTNLLHLKKEHVGLFKKYRTNVGFSVDGDNAYMNMMRFRDNDELEMTRKTAGVLNSVFSLIENKIHVSMISVLWKCNSDPIQFVLFLERMINMGVGSVRLNPGISNDRDLEISADKLYELYSFLFDSLYAVPRALKIQVSPFADIIEMMMGYNESRVCSFGNCDSWKTAGEATIMADGNIGCCLHTGAALDGLQIPAHTSYYHERDESLRQTPEKYGGCKHCIFWFMCFGLCPGAGIDGDYRNRSRFCQAFKRLYKKIYRHIKNLFPNYLLVPDFYPEIPNLDEIKKSRENSAVHLKYRIKPARKTEIKWKPIILPGGITHGDSDDPKWRKLNPGWGK